MTDKDYMNAQQRIEVLTISYSALTEEEKQELYYLERACEEYEGRALLNQMLKDVKENTN